jgi:hypothetical protein
VSLPSRAAAVRGDDFQYTIGWYRACVAITEPGVDTVEVEDRGAGSYDDVVTRRYDGRHLFQQVKNSNYSDVVISETWLLTSTDGGRSPLQHFHDSWKALRTDGTPEFKLVANRGLDSADPLLKLRDRNTNLLLPKAAGATAGSNAGKARKRWAAALEITVGELLEFLADFQIVLTDNENSWRSHIKPLMRLAGLRSDDEAVTIGIDIVRGWVKNGAGPRTPAQIRAEAAGRKLLADDDRVVLAVDAIDHPGSSNLPTVKLGWVERFDGDTPRQRRLLRKGYRWEGLSDELTAAEKTLGDFGVRRVLVEGAMRLPLWFAVGAAFPDTRRWELEVDQRGELWSSSVPGPDPEPGQDNGARLLNAAEVNVGGGTGDVAVVISLTNDATAEVVMFVKSEGLADRVLTVTTDTGPGQDAVRGGTHARTWARSARDLLRKEISQFDRRPSKLHLFMAAPAGAALLLGHDWNLMPETVVYEHLDPGYAITLIVT